MQYDGIKVSTFDKRSIFDSLSGFTYSELTKGKYLIKKLVNFTGIGEIALKSDWLKETFANGEQKSILMS